MADNYAPQFDALTAEQLGIDPAALDAQFGIAQPPLDTYQAPDLTPGLGERFVEGLSPLAGQQYPVHNFGEGFFAGLAGGLGGAGVRAQARRAALEKAIAERAAKRDAANLQATRDLKTARSQAFAAANRETADAARRQKDYERDTTPVTQEFLDANPHLKRLGVKPGDRIPNSIALAAPKEIKDTSAENLVEVTNPDGSKTLVRKRPGLQVAPKPSEGTGKPPTEFQARVQIFGKSAYDADAAAQAGGLENRILKKAWNVQAPPALQGGDRDVRAYWRAMESFTLALNRLESGANVTPTEFSRVRALYFVQPGDGPQDIAAKAELRKARIAELEKLQAPGSAPFGAGAGQTAAAPPIPATWKKVP